MTVNVSLSVGGTTVEDFEELNIETNNGDYNTSSNFQVTIDSPYGRHKSDFTIGEEVAINADKDQSPETNIFTGIVESISFSGEENEEKITLSGRDYTARLMDATVEPTVYTNSEISTIVTDIINNFVEDITTTNVNVTGLTLERIAFNHVNAFDAIQQLAELAGFRFYVDSSKDLHFEERAETTLSDDAGITLNNTNVYSATFDTTREGFANHFWVYGDRFLTAAPTEILSAGNPAGSVFTLVSRPHNTTVFTSNTTPGSPLKGGIFNIGITNFTSGVDYLVNFYDKQIIFVSGTDIGYSTYPNNNGSVVVEYFRETPIVKFGRDSISSSLYGPKNLIIKDKNIKDPKTAERILKEKIKETSPLEKMELGLKGWFTFNVGQTVTLNIPDFNINNETYVPILSINYNFTKESQLSERIITVRLKNKITDITDSFKEMNDRIVSIEGEDFQQEDLLTRLEFSTGSVLVVGSVWSVATRNINDSFILSHSNNAVLGHVGSPNIGSIEGATWESGNLGFGYDKALGFDGTNDRVTVPNHINLNPEGNDFSISFWLKNPDSPGIRRIIDKLHNVGLNGWEITYRADQTIRFTIAGPSTTFNLNSVSLINDNQWHHIVGAFDRPGGAGGAIHGSLYIDGQVDATGKVTIGFGPISGTQDLFIGNRGPSLSQFYSGILDDIRVYKGKELNPSEVGSLFEKKNYPTGSLYAYWTFDEGAGIYAYSSASGTTVREYKLQPILNDRRGDLTVRASGGYSYTDG